VSESLGDVAAFGVFFHGKYDFAVHCTHPQLVYCYTGTGTLSTISRKISSAC
jgi:hypothetical protein